MGREELIRSYLDKYQRAFRLLDWDIRYNQHHDRKAETWANVYHQSGAHIASVTINADTPDEYVEDSIIHEMMHVVLQPVWEAFGHLAAKNGKAGQALLDLMAEQMELVCNRVAHAFTGEPYRLAPKDKRTRRQWAPFCAPDHDHGIAMEVA